jgi:hypothetical protein
VNPIRLVLPQGQVGWEEDEMAPRFWTRCVIVTMPRAFSEVLLSSRAPSSRSARVRKRRPASSAFRPLPRSHRPRLPCGQ